MGMVAPVYCTADMVRAVPDDGNSYEVVYGELLVTPAPRSWHEVIVGRLYSAVDAYLRAERVGHVFAAGPTSPGARTSSSNPTSSLCPWSRPARSSGLG